MMITPHILCFLAHSGGTSQGRWEGKQQGEKERAVTLLIDKGLPPLTFYAFVTLNGDTFLPRICVQMGQGSTQVSLSSMYLS